MKISYSELQNNEYDPHTLNEIKLFKDDRIEYKEYLSKGYKGRTLTEIRLAHKSGVDLSYYLDKGFRDSELSEIRLALEDKVNIKRFIDIDMCDVQIEQIKLGLSSKIDVSQYATVRYNWMQMREIRLGIENNINVSLYSNEYFDYKQMKEIREGIEEGLDVSPYAKVIFSISDMKKIHNELKMALGIDSYNENITLAIDKFNSLLEGNSDYSPCEVLITRDKLSAYMILNRPQNEKKYTVGQILACLEDNGVYYGVSSNTVQDAIDNEKYDINLLVATAKKPVPGKDGYYDFFFKKELCNKPKVLEDGSVDYKEVDLFEAITEGQFIAEYHKAELGGKGISVEGNIIPAIYGKELPPLKGKGFKITEDGARYYATVTGRIERIGYTLNINKVLVVDDDIKPGVGNVKFDGDVVIKGKVCSGMSVEATSNVLIKGVVEGAIIKCGGSITVKSGVLGNQKAELSAEKNVYCYFVENAKISTGEDFYADYILGCEVTAKKNIYIVGRKGSIIGGYTYAGLLIKAVYAGNKTGIKTEIELGINAEFSKREFTKYKEQKKIQNNIKELNECKRTLEESDEDENVSKYYSRVCQAIEMENVYYDSLQKEIDVIKKEKIEFLNAKLVVSQGMFPGCIVRKNGNCKRIE